MLFVMVAILEEVLISVDDMNVYQKYIKTQENNKTPDMVRTTHTKFGGKETVGIAGGGKETMGTSPRQKEPKLEQRNPKADKSPVKQWHQKELKIEKEETESNTKGNNSEMEEEYNNFLIILLEEEDETKEKVSEGCEPEANNQIQGVPQNCIHFVCSHFSASRASRVTNLDSFTKPCPCRY